MKYYTRHAMRSCDAGCQEVGRHDAGASVRAARAGARGMSSSSALHSTEPLVPFFP